MLISPTASAPYLLQTKGPRGFAKSLPPWSRAETNVRLRPTVLIIDWRPRAQKLSRSNPLLRRTISTASNHWPQPRPGTKECGPVALNQLTTSKTKEKGNNNMGLTIHYSLKARGSDAQARNLINALHQTAQDLPFKELG